MVFERVSFAYGKDSKPALENVSLTFRPGEKVAILGRIGSGKSTLLKLAAGLYEPALGMTSLDDVDLRQIDPYFLRSEIGLLGQSPRLFFGTLRENLDLARSDGYYSDEILLAALKRFGLDRLIQSHPHGLDMHLGEGGIGLSGGQQQIVNLARLTLRNPKVVLLDEPTSGLDQNTEQQVLHALSQWLNNRTMIVVTHRPQILMLVDRIIVMEQGQVVIDGPKQAVLDRLSGKTVTEQQPPSKPNQHQETI